MLDGILGTKTKLAILRLLSAEPTREFTVQDLASVLDLSTGSLHPAVQQLVGARIVLSRRVGRSRALRMNRRHPLADSVRRLFRDEASRMVAVAREFAAHLPEKGVEAAILFGSVSRGEVSPRSDVDVLVVVDPSVDREPIRRAADSLLDRFDVTISPLILDRREVDRRLADFDPLLLTIAKEGNLLRGKARWLER